MGVTNEVLFEVECDEPEGKVIRKVTPFVFSEENLLKLWAKVSQFPTLMGKEVRDFNDMLYMFIHFSETNEMRAKGLCCQIDDLVGIFWLTDIEWPGQASLHYTFFDRRHRGRHDLCKAAIKYVFHKYKFHRVYTQVPLYAKYVLKFVGELGFKKEGRLRSTVFHKNVWYDSNIYSILSEEV